MAKLQKNQSGFSLLEAILILIIIGLIGSVGWYVLHAKSNAEKNLRSINTTVPTYNKKTLTQSAAVKLPDGWTWYEGNGFKFGYPAAYGKFSSMSTTQEAGGIQTVMASGEPASALFPGLLAARMFILDDYGSTNAAIQSRKYGPTIKLEIGKWVVASDNPSDPKKYKSGDIYDEVVTTKSSGMTVYTLTSGDEGGVLYRLAFTAKSHLYILQLPEFDTGGYASQTTNDQKPYDQLASQLAEHVITD